tara:strand:- start:973 stop:1215 length:243 start_codon:yes stop_codon:yes gene_type:complete
MYSGKDITGGTTMDRCKMERQELIDILGEMNTFNNKCFQARRGVNTYRKRIEGKINKLLRKHYGSEGVLTEEEYRYLVYM